MKRPAVVVAAVVAVLLAGVLLARAAWSDRSVPSASASPAVTVPPGNALAGPAGWRYRHSQPTHWRPCLLRR